MTKKSTASSRESENSRIERPSYLRSGDRKKFPESSETLRFHSSREERRSWSHESSAADEARRALERAKKHRLRSFLGVLLIVALVYGVVLYFLKTKGVV